MLGDIRRKKNNIAASSITGNVFPANATFQFGKIIFGTEFVGLTSLKSFLPHNLFVLALSLYER